MTDDVKAALEFAEWLRDSAIPYPSGLTLVLNGSERYLVLLAAEVRRLHGQTCETCSAEIVHTSSDYKRRWFTCDITGLNCEMMGGGCRAHTPKVTR